ncbi:peptidoglycan DD-metalloendopeptidase family protein [Alphaproteobacteria bacterium]|nr:peptidoglycan DD-metalloendopeptidase family protein [Alphaproteobacteria bacterium]
MNNLIKLIFLIFFLISGVSQAEENITIISKNLKKGDTFYKAFSQAKINTKNSKLFISSLKRRLDLTKMPTGQEIKFYFKINTNMLLAVAVPLKKNITVLSWRKGKKITSARISDILVNDRVQAILDFEDFKPKPGLYIIKVNKGDNLTRLLSNSGVNVDEINNIVQLISSQRDLRKLKPNDELKLFYNADRDGIFLEKINLTMSGKSILIKKDSFKLFRLFEKEDTKINRTPESREVKTNTIQGQLRDAGWGLKETREALDAFSTVYDPTKIVTGYKIIFPKDGRIKAFAIRINKKSAIVVIKINDGKFLAKKQSFILAKSIVSSLKFIEEKNRILKNIEIIEKKIIVKNKNTLADLNIENNDLYYESNLIEGKIEKGDTLLARLIALGEKKKIIRKVLRVLSEKMNPNMVKAGSSIIVALGKDKKPMIGLFIESSRKKGYLVILNGSNYIVKKTSIIDAKVELAELVKPNFNKRKKPIAKQPEWKNKSLIKPSRNSIKIFTFKNGDTLSHAFSSLNISENKIFGFVNKLKSEFDPRKLLIGQKIKIYFDKNDAKIINGIVIQVDKIRSIEVFKYKKDFLLNKYKEPTIKTFHKVTGIIDSSLYMTAKNAGMPISVLMEVIKLYSFDVDFQREIKSGDAFEVMYQLKHIRSGALVSSGPVLRSVLTLDGERLPLYRFEYEKDYFDYFDSDASSVRKALMRTPLDGARISSGFGKRKHPVLGYTKMHKGVDFAASRNTPIFAAGDGIIELSRKNGSYGNYIRIRHNSDYKTAYAHLARFGKGIKEGRRVKQGDVIGYVGTTGRSTGPHLHYEIIFRNKQVNPLKVRMPKGVKLKNDDYNSFIKTRDRLDDIWDSL